MLTILNRKELLTVLSEAQMQRIGNALYEAGIPYRTAVMNRGGLFAQPRRRGLFQNSDYKDVYRIFVEPCDDERAMQVIQPVLRNT